MHPSRHVRANTSLHTRKQAHLQQHRVFPALTWAAVAAVWRRRDSSHRHRATIRAISIGFSRYLLCKEEWKRMKSSGRLSSCGWNFANLKLNSPQIECYIYYTKQQNKGFRARLQSVGDEGEKRRQVWWAVLLWKTARSSECLDSELSWAYREATSYVQENSTMAKPLTLKSKSHLPMRGPG